MDECVLYIIGQLSYNGPSHVSILYMSTCMWTCCMSVLVDMLCTCEHTGQVLHPRFMDCQYPLSTLPCTNQKNYYVSH